MNVTDFSKNISVCLHIIRKKLKRKKQLHEVYTHSKEMNHDYSEVSFVRAERDGGTVHPV